MATQRNYEHLKSPGTRYSRSLGIPFRRWFTQVLYANELKKPGQKLTDNEITELLRAEFGEDDYRIRSIDAGYETISTTRSFFLRGYQRESPCRRRVPIFASFRYDLFRGKQIPVARNRPLTQSQIIAKMNLQLLRWLSRPHGKQHEWWLLRRQYSAMVEYGYIEKSLAISSLINYPEIVLNKPAVVRRIRCQVFSPYEAEVLRREMAELRSVRLVQTSEEARSI